MKYADEELSRILSAAAVGGLIAGGDMAGTGIPCCLVQAALASAFGLLVGHDEVAIWFDREVDNKRLRANSPDAMLRALEKKGWA